MNNIAVGEILRGDVGAGARKLASALRHDPQLTVARENIDVVGLRWVRQAYALGLGAVLALGLAFLLEWLAFSDGARPPLRLVVGVAASAALVWWDRRVWREVPPAIRRPLVRRLVRRPLLLLVVVLNGLVLLLLAALTFLPYDVAVLSLVLVRPIAWLNIAYVVASVVSVRRSRSRFLLRFLLL